MKKTATNIMRRRMRGVLFCFLVLGFSVVIGRLFLLQVIHGETYQSAAVQQQTRSTTLDALRGKIYDRNGVILARSATVWNVCLSPAQIRADQLEAIVENLSRLLDVDAAKIREQAKDKAFYYKLVKKRVDRTLMEEVLAWITENKIDGVFFEESAKRYYAYNSLASTVIGFTDFDGNGAYGLEAYYNKVLSGTPGMVVSAKNAWGADMSYKYQQMYAAKDGNSIVLTIDEAVQHYLEKNLETAIVEHSIGNRAAGIVMNVKTGEILAMSSKPDFDLNDPYTLQDPAAAAKLAALTPGTEEYTALEKQLWYDQWRNKAISDPYEPGSVFKIVTASTALDNNKVSLSDHFFCSGSMTVSGHNFGCWKAGGHGSQNFIEGMQNSCNPVFITVGQRIGARLFFDYINNFGFGKLTGIDLPAEAPGILQPYELLSKEGMVELGSTSFGQTFKVTPLQLITAASAAVNGGNLMKPYIVKQVLDPEGNVLKTTQPTVQRQVISAQTSETMRLLTEAVVNGGSGRYAAIPGYSIGGKTGTSQKIDQGDEKHVLSFIGFAPMEDPQIAVLIMLDEPKLDNVFGSTIAAPVVGAVLQEVLPQLGIAPQFTQEQLAKTEVEIPDLTGEKPHDAQAKLTNMELKTRFVGNGAEVLKQIPQPWQKVPKGGTVILYTEEELLESGIAVPDVVGMLTQEANRTIVELGLNIELRGAVHAGASTVVSEQWPLPGTEANTGDVIIVTLKEVPPEPIAQTDAVVPDEPVPMGPMV